MLTDNDLKSYINGYLQDRKMSYTRLDKYDRAIEILINENKQLHSIIKEVREYIEQEEISIIYQELGLQQMNVKNELLEILERENNDK